jgi:hypothetical protein
MVTEKSNSVVIKNGLLFMLLITMLPSLYGQIMKDKNQSLFHQQKEVYTYIELQGKNIENISLSYSLHGVCAQNTAFYSNRHITGKLPVELFCFPAGDGDFVSINIIKPLGYNLINPDGSKYNDPEIGNMVLRIDNSLPLQLKIVPVKVLDLYYFDLNQLSDKMGIVRFLNDAITIPKKAYDEWYLYVSNHNRPLTLSSTEFLSDNSVKNNFLNRIQSLSPDPSNAKDDAERIANELQNMEVDFHFKRINIHFFAPSMNAFTYNTILNGISNALPHGNRGKVYLYFDNEAVQWEVDFDVREKLHKNKIEYVIY